MKRIKVISARPLEVFVALVGFSDGTEREIDLAKYLDGEVFDEIRNNRSTFRSLRIENRTIAWDNGADIDPYTLYYDLPTGWSEKDEDLAGLLALRRARRENEGPSGFTLEQVKEELGLR